MSYERSHYHASTNLQTWNTAVRRNNETESSNILLSLLHITQGLIKYFVKAIKQTGPSFIYLVKKFPEMTAANLSDAVFSFVRSYASTSEMSSPTEFSVATRKVCGMISGV